jgi:N-acetylmuramoyl-L-alanine amidase
LSIFVGLLAAITLAACGGGDVQLGGVISDPPQAPPPILTPSSVVSSTPATSAAPSPSPTAGSRLPDDDGSAPASPADPGDGADHTDDPPAEQPVIVVDPGHSGESIKSETETGLTDFDYPNKPEMDEVYEISTCVADALENLDYEVIMTKEAAADTVGLVERARVANRADADLAISVHNDHSQDPAFQAVYSQRGTKEDGEFGEMWRGTGDNRTVFDRPQVADDSARYARIIARERSKAQDRDVSITEFDFVGREGLEPGNIPMVMLFAEVPWVYNEAGAMTGGSTTQRMPRSAQLGYAQGLLNGIVAAVPPPGNDAAPRLTCNWS